MKRGNDNNNNTEDGKFGIVYYECVLFENDNMDVYESGLLRMTI